MSDLVKDSAQPLAGKAFTVEEVLKAYNADPALDGAGKETAFISLGGTLPKGWQEYLRAKGIDPDTVKVINTSDRALEPDPEGANGENALDLFIHKQGLPKAVVSMVSGENTDAGFPKALDRATFPP